MKASETKSTHSQQHEVADHSSAERAFFSESSEQTAFFHPMAVPGLQPKPMTQKGTFFQPTSVPTVQAKCAACASEDKLQPEVMSSETTVQRVSAFESGAEPPDDSHAEPPPVQFSLTIGQPGDPYEREADTIADRVMMMPEPGMTRVNNSPKSLVIQRFSLSSLEGKEKHLSAGGTVQAKELNNQSSDATSTLETRLSASKGRGEPLPKETRSFMESRFGQDFSGVRVHTNTDSVEMNQALKAKAFTHQQDIYFGAGQYSPESAEGKRLLAHELTHTVQQGGNTLQTKEQTGEAKQLTTDVPDIQAAWYNFDIPFTDYQFDPSIQGIKNAANIVKDTAAEGLEWILDEIKGLISSGINWLSEKWAAIQEFASSGFDAVKKVFTNILSLVKTPLNHIANAVMGLSAETLASAWSTFKEVVTRASEGFKLLAGGLLQQVNNLWGKISGYATSVLNKVVGLTENYLFKKLPNALQKIAFTLINQIRSLWKSINDEWTKIFNKIKTWIDNALDVVFKFVQRIISFGVNVVIEGIKQFGKLVLFLKDLFTNPQKYIDILVKKTVKAFDGVEAQFSLIVEKYFGNSQAPTQATNITGAIQKQPISNSTAETKRSASWGEIGRGIWKMMGKKWDEFKANPWSVVTGLLMDMVLPIVGNVKDIIQLFKDIRKIVTAPLSAGSLEEAWTSFLQILDIPILIYHTVVSILMRQLMVPLIVASFIRHPLVTAIASAVGYALLGAFIQSELLNIGHKLLLLKTGATTEEQKNEAYNRIADSLIAFAMAAVMVLIMLILHFIANVLKGIYNFVKGKVFNIETAPVEGKGGSPSEGKAKGGTEEGKGAEAKSPTEEVPSEDGKRKLRMDEEGKCEVCASPCEKIREKYKSVMTPEIDAEIKAIEGDATLTDAQKEAKLKPIEQKLSNLKAQGVDISNDVKVGKRGKPTKGDWSQVPNWEDWVTDRGGSIIEHPDGSYTMAADGTEVRFDPFGEPDFSPHMKDSPVKEGQDIGKYVDNTTDFKAANEKSGHPEWGSKSPEDFTWHHTRPPRTVLQLIPRRIHQLFRHTGKSYKPK